MIACLPSLWVWLFAAHLNPKWPKFVRLHLGHICHVICGPFRSTSRWANVYHVFAKTGPDMYLDNRATYPAPHMSHFWITPGLAFINSVVFLPKWPSYDLWFTVSRGTAFTQNEAGTWHKGKVSGFAAPIYVNVHEMVRTPCWFVFVMSFMFYVCFQMCLGSRKNDQLDFMSACF